MELNGFLCSPVGFSLASPGGKKRSRLRRRCEPRTYVEMPVDMTVINGNTEIFDDNQRFRLQTCSIAKL